MKTNMMVGERAVWDGRRVKCVEIVCLSHTTSAQCGHCVFEGVSPRIYGEVTKTEGSPCYTLNCRANSRGDRKNVVFEDVRDAGARWCYGWMDANGNDIAKYVSERQREYRKRKEGVE